MLFVAEIVSAENNIDGEPLTYRDYRYYLKDDVNIITTKETIFFNINTP